jgi:hypothetical protein
MANDSRIFAQLRDDGFQRLTIPKDLADRIAWLGGDDVSAWLFVLAAGRYRLLPDAQVQADPKLQPLRAHILGEQEAQPSGTPTSACGLQASAMVVRLIPVSVHRYQQSWKLSKPKALKLFASPSSDPGDFTLIFSIDGYWELWNTTLLCNAALTELPPED